jgi:hypothetical protein
MCFQQGVFLFALLGGLEERSLITPGTKYTKYGQAFLP